MRELANKSLFSKHLGFIVSSVTHSIAKKEKGDAFWQQGCKEYENLERV